MDISTSSAAHGLAARAPLAAFLRGDPDDQAFADLLRRLGHEADAVQGGGIEGALRWCADNPAPALLIADISGCERPLLVLRDLLERCDPACRVILLGRDSDLDLYRRLLQAGASEYLCKPVPMDLLAATLARCASRQGERAARPGADARQGRTIAFAGVTGGSGCSTLAAGLARWLVGQRHAPLALVDFDREQADQALLLGQTVEQGVFDNVLMAGGEIDVRLLERALSHGEERLRLLGQHALGRPAAADPQRVLDVGATLCEMFNLVIWDLPSRRDAAVWEVLHNADVRVLVCELDVKGLRSAHRLLQELGDERAGQRLLLVGNQGRYGDAVLEPRAYAELLGRPLDVVVPHAGAALARGLIDGRLDGARHPGFGQAMAVLAALLRGQAYQPESQPRLRQWLRRLTLVASPKPM